MRELSQAEQDFLQIHRVARLATADAQGQPYAVPICYAFDGRWVYSALDEKPKSVEPTRLKRVRNIQANPRVALVVDDYAEDWRLLAYIQLRGQADLLPVGAEAHAGAVRLLRAKYPQYEQMAIDQQPVLRIAPEAIVTWGAVAAPYVGS
ncbi:MAG TPA: TIGR03668 family PPOX class F420-dependent oxidoreductase [Ktedonobacterales bacterium]|nr:TIGR03668 family PPOX class F420-dependent oxidoreductase [Ktedonobacterales bacterium]